MLLLPGDVIGTVLARAAGHLVRCVPARHVLLAVCLLFTAVVGAANPRPWGIALVAMALRADLPEDGTSTDVR